MIIIESILFIWLLVLAVVDIRKGSFSGRNLVLAAILFSTAMAVLCFLNVKEWKMFLGGGAAGAVFILASIVTKGAVGIGDGYILMVCGMVLRVISGSDIEYSGTLSCVGFWNFIMGS